MSKCVWAWVAIFTVLPLATYAQVARNGNEYDFRDHQPTASVQSQERRAGVAADAAQNQTENQDLFDLNKKLEQRAQDDAQALPGATENPYGVQPGGVVHTSPNAAGGGAASGTSR